MLITTIEILLTADQNRSRARSPDYRHYYLTLKRDTVPVYSKASKSSHIEKTTPYGIRQFFCDYSIASIDDSGTYWHVSHWGDGAYVSGFIHEEEVVD